jgi:hypothetical protein
MIPQFNQNAIDLSVLTTLAIIGREQDGQIG